MRKGSWVAATIAALTLVGVTPTVADASTHTLSVVGSGKVFVRPDVADVTLSVKRTAATSQQALSTANRAADAVVRAVVALGIPARDVQTQNVDVFSFRRKHHKRWSADEMLDVHITKVKLVGRVIDSATRAGASSVSGPTFSFSDPSAGVEAATRAAITDAHRRAEDAAAAIDYKLTGVRSIVLNPQGGPVLPGSGVPSAPNGSAGAPTTIYPGAQEVDAQVAIVYTIAPA